MHPFFTYLKTLSRKILILLCLLISGFAYAQEGSSYVTNFNLSETVHSNQNWAIVQDDDEVMLFANRRGILTYDGANWQEISLPDIVFSMADDPEKNRIYAGCRNGFGYLAKDEKGIYRYTELSTLLKDVSEISKIELTADAVYFCNNRSITRCMLGNLSNTRKWSATTNPFAGTIKFKDNIYVNISGKGLHKIEKDTLVQVKGVTSLPDEILFSVAFDEKHVLVGTGNDELFLFDGKAFTKFVFEGQKHVIENILATGVELNENEIAVSTLTGGCLIVDKKTGATSQSISYRTGLPDDELYAIGKDRNNGLWLSHEYGLSRIDNNLPVRNYGSYPGLEGNLNAVATSKGTVYVATSQGVYYLTKTFDSQEVQKLIQLQNKEMIERTKAEDKKTATQIDYQKLFEEADETDESATTNKQPDKEEKKQLREEKKKKNKEKWNNFFGVKKKDSKGQEEAQPEITEVENGEDKPAPVEEKKEEPVVQEEIKQAEPLKTSNKQAVKQAEPVIQPTKFGTNIYKKVPGLNEKCKQMVAYNDQLLVATNMGLYVVKDNAAKALVPGRNINCISASGNGSRFYLGTTTGVFSVKWSGGNWVVEDNFENFDHPVYSITEERGNNLWLGSDGVVFRVILNESASPVTTKSYSFNKDYADKVITGRVEGKVNFFLSSGIYIYDGTKDSLVNTDRNDDGTLSYNRRYVSSQENITWSYNNTDKKWKSYKNDPSQNLIYSVYLDLFDGIQNIFVDVDGNFWVIDGKNALYKILPYEKFINMHDFNVYIRGISNDGENNFSLEQFVVDAGNNMLSFKIAAPYYLKTDATEYQYIIDGLTSDWSKWSSTAIVGPFPFPPGNYTLRVRARNILGKISEEKTMSFSINPPFYKTWYFYLLYIAVGMGIIWSFIRFRELRLKREQAILEEKVRTRTAELAAQKEKTEELLLNILPHETAEELKSKGFATTRFYNMASVMFTDFKDFTKISETMKPTELIGELDTCFKAFDDIIEKYNLEKIKTIGDSYMCAGGIPVADDFNPIRITLAALEICAFMIERRKDKHTLAPFEIRVGIHTGPITAGVVGKKKFAYDIWSDSVNTASRMESSGKVGMVNVSGTTYEFIKPYFECTYRGKIEAKNKGEIDMYFVTSIKEKYSVGSEGKVPNEIFLELLASEESLQKV